MASDLIKHQTPAAADLEKLWENWPVKPFFSPEDIERAGGMEKFFRGEFMTRPADPVQEKVMMTGRRTGKSVAQKYYKNMKEIIHGEKATFIILDEYGSVDAGKINDLNGESMAKTTKGQPSISPEALVELEHMAQQMTNRAALMMPQMRRVTLASPANLTVVGAKGYRKANHIGGEEFELIAVRVGSPQKGHRLIFEFKPTSVSLYDTMEMTQQECESGLNDWRMVADMAAGGNFYVELEKVRNIDTAQLMKVENSRLSQEYGEFGAW